MERARGRFAAAIADGGLDQLVAVSDDEGRHASLRRLICDLLEEYGRHTGHADLLREAVDGLVGDDPPAGWRPDSLTSRHPQSPSTSPPIRTMNPLTTTMKNTRTNVAPRATAIRAPR